MLLVKQLQRNFEFALTDKTPRSNYVGNDIYSQFRLLLDGFVHYSLAHVTYRF